MSWSSASVAPIHSVAPELSLISNSIVRSTSSSSSSTHSAQPTPTATDSNSSQPHTPSPIAFIAVHAGAGYLHPSKHTAICSLLRLSCSEALKQAGTVEEAAAVALSVLESSPLTNAGVGSCLTEDGRVEGEASIVFGNGTFGSVGAVSGVDHPIQVAYQLAVERNQHSLIKELSRVRPISLVGEGAYQFAQSRGLGVVRREEIDAHHVTDTTMATWRRYKQLIDKQKSSQRHGRNGQSEQGNGKGSEESEGENGVECVDGQAAAKRTRSESDQTNHNSTSPPAAAPGEVPESQGDSASSTPDTVGVVVCDHEGRVCAASSSGGIWMKHRGRLGSSSMAGSGCYAENFDDDDLDEQQAESVSSVAASVSGCGESVMEQFMAMRCCELMKGVQQKEEEKEKGSQHSSTAHKSMRDVMYSLLMRKQVPMSSEMIKRKRRRRNSSGGQDTLEDDDGLATGVISLQAAPLPLASSHITQTATQGSAASQQRRDKGTDKDEEGEGRMGIRFSWAHTARHFAVGFAGRRTAAAADDTVYDGEAWVSVLSEHSRGECDREGHKEAGLKMGEVVREIAYTKSNSKSETESDRHKQHNNRHSQHSQHKAVK